MRQRYYNPEIKRFVNQDILTGSIGNSQSLNRYSYVQSNPVSYTDPFGLSPFNGLFSGTNLVHSLLGLVGWIPGPIGAVANGIDGVVYALADKDYKNAILSAGSAFTFGAGKIAAKVGKGSKTALRVQRVCNFAGSGINFAQSAEGTYQTASMMADKYIVQGQSFSGTTVLEFVLLAANVTGTYKSGTYAINDVVDGVRAVGRQYASWKEAKARSAGQSGSKSVKTGEFFIDDWTGYPDAPKPDGPFRILEGTEYTDARNLANKTNANIHRNRPDLKGTQIHEMHPVKFGGSPTDIDNKIALSPKEHAKYTAFWNKVLREQKGK